MYILAQVFAGEAGVKNRFTERKHGFGEKCRLRWVFFVDVVLVGAGVGLARRARDADDRRLSADAPSAPPAE